MRLHLYGLATVAFAVALACGVNAAQHADPAHVALRAAMDTEVVDGDLAAAIKQYQAIVEKYASSDRATAAAALVRLGGCYQKLGDSQARAVYARVLRDFGDINEAAATARSQLSALEAGARAPARGGLALRRIYEGPQLDWCNGLSSDLRYLSHADWATGNIAVADLTSGQVRLVTTTGSINQRGGDYGECSVFSPDDRQLAYFWQEKERFELRVIGVDGAKPQVVYRSERYLRPVDWSRDGRSLLVAEYLAGSRQLTLVPVAGGPPRPLTVALQPSYALFSPDARFVAYQSPASQDSPKSDLFLMSTGGGDEVELVRHPADDKLLGWADDGRRVFFSSDRTGSYGVWSLAVENGKPLGAPVLVKADVGSLTPVRLLKGTLYYMTSSTMSDVYVAPIDLEAGTLLADPVPVKKYASTSNFAPSWSPDGTSLAYRTIPGAADPWARPPAVVSIVDLRTGEERSVRPALDAFDPNDGPHWSPDGRSLLVIGMQGTPQSGVHKVDAQTGATARLAPAAPGQWLLYAIWSRDGRSVFYTTGNPTRILRRDLATGAEVEIVRPGNPGGSTRIALSPDGRALAFISHEPADRIVKSVKVIPAVGGTPREIYRTREGENVGPLAWTPDGRHVVVRKVITATGKGQKARQELWRISADGGGARRIDVDLGNFGLFALSPDGRRIAFARGETRTELWALENLTGAVKGS